MSDISKANEIESFVAQKISRLSVGDPWSIASLARLRRVAGRDAEESSEVWDITLDDMPAGLSGFMSNGSYHPSEAENAIHHALTLYAIHQQGSASDVNARNVSIGKAVKRLMGKTSSDDGVKSRFKAMTSSEDVHELTYHLRGIIQLLKANGPITLDYPRLAKDIYLFSSPEWRDNVMFRWAEDFYTRPAKTDSENNDKEE